MENGVVFDATVEEIERGKISGERLYRIRYSDGDLEHLTAQQVEECLIPDNGQEKEKLSTVMRKPAAGRVPAIQAEEEDEDEPPTPVKKRPATESTQAEEEEAEEEE